MTSQYFCVSTPTTETSNDRITAGKPKSSGIRISLIKMHLPQERTAKEESQGRTEWQVLLSWCYFRAV
jgi:hypothetical protein